MGKNLYSDFAVLTAAGRAVDFTQVAEGLRIIPLFNSVTLSGALKGLVDGDGIGLPYYNGFEGDPGSYVPLDVNGSEISNVTIQHDSDGYVRFVGKLKAPDIAVNPEVDPNPDPEPVPAIQTLARGFALVDISAAASDYEPGHVGHIYAEAGGKSDNMTVLAVASIDRGYDMGNECYVSFTITTVNNYKSVTFNPNAFATMEDLAEINGLDGLHIAFDTKSGDIKLLDKEGKVLDQANLHMDTDTIIADGEEGYKYVKTDIDQDIHSVKAFMPDGLSAFDNVEGQDYEVVSAALLLNLSELMSEVNDAQDVYDSALSDLEEAQSAVDEAQTALDQDDGSDPSATAQLEQALADAQSNLESAQSAVDETKMSLEHAQESVEDAKQAARNGDFSDVCGIRVIVDDEATDYFIGGEYSNSKVGASDVAFLTDEDNGEVQENQVLVPVYSQSAFVWTVGKDVGGEIDVDPNFAQQMNAHAQALGFHIGDDIPLGTNLPDLLEKMSSDFDAEAYMHDTFEMNDEEYTVDELVDEQRNLAKAELVAWNAQHPALALAELEGTRVSKDGVDIRNGNIRIGNGMSAGFPHQYDIATNIGDTEHTNGLQIGVIDSYYGGGNSGTPRNIVTINKDDYISGAPICMVLAQFYISRIQQADLPDIVTPGVEVKRKTANFSVSVPDDLADGTFALTINDTRPDVEQAMGAFSLSRIIEIVPVYTPGADTSEAVPALTPIHAIGGFQGSGSRSLTVQCSQVLDWANSLGIDGTGNGNQPDLFLIIKVY